MTFQQFTANTSIVSNFADVWIRTPGLWSPALPTEPQSLPTNTYFLLPHLLSYSDADDCLSVCFSVLQTNNFSNLSVVRICTVSCAKHRQETRRESGNGPFKRCCYRTKIIESFSQMISRVSTQLVEFLVSRICPNNWTPLYNDQHAHLQAL